MNEFTITRRALCVPYAQAALDVREGLARIDGGAR